MTQIIETIGRSAILAAASNYQSVADALMELVECRRAARVDTLGRRP